MGEREGEKGKTETASETETQRTAERKKWEAEEKGRETQMERGAERET